MLNRSHVRVALVTALVLVLLLVPTALAGKGKPGGNTGGSYTVSIDQPGPYYFGQQVTVTTTAPLYANNMGPFISLACYQNGVLVGSEDHAGFEGGWYYGMPFTLGPSTMWTGGAADCRFTVFHMSNKRRSVDATMSFHVNP